MRWLALGLVLLAGPAWAQPRVDDGPAVAIEPLPPPRGIVRFGLGYPELAHVSVGVFFSPWLTGEAMLSWNGAAGNRFGAGMFYALGAAYPNRPPRHALLLGARVMLATTFRFDSHGDDLSSYVVTPLGYQYMGAGGLAASVTLGPLWKRVREDDGGHHLGVGIAATASFGRWF